MNHSCDPDIDDGAGIALEVNSGGTLAVSFRAAGLLRAARGRLEHRLVHLPGGNLLIGSPDGITSSGATGSIQTTARSFSTSANYIYNDSSAQDTGNGLPGTVNNLTISSSAGVYTQFQCHRQRHAHREQRRSLDVGTPTR